MIIHSYDVASESITSPKAFVGEQKHICDVAIATFSQEIFSAALEKYPHRQICDMHAANKTKPLMLLSIGGLDVAFYLSEIGSAMAANDIIEINWVCGATKFIAFGSSGSLDRAATEGKYVIPTEAYRDEGMSYHYAPPADYIKIGNADLLGELFSRWGLPHISGRVWTTDAFYRETRNLVNQRKSEGCVAVEMELAGMQAVCDFHHIELYDFLVTGDVVDQDVYTPEGLHEANHSMDKFDIAIKIAQFISGHNNTMS